VGGGDIGVVLLISVVKVFLLDKKRLIVWDQS